MIDTTGLSKADVLAALYNSSRPQGMGFMSYDPEPMTSDEASELLGKTTYFDYLKGRVMKISLDSDEGFEERNYDRDNGSGAAQNAIDALRAGGVNSDAIQAAHVDGLDTSAALTHNRLHAETRTSDGDGMKVVTLGLSDVKDQLKPAIDKAKKSVAR